MNWFTSAETDASKIEAAVKKEFESLVEHNKATITAAEAALAAVKTTGEAHVAAVVAAAKVAGAKLVADAVSVATAAAQVKVNTMVAQVQATAQAAVAASTATVTTVPPAA
jgi:CHASE3 domain sensor protein